MTLRDLTARVRRLDELSRGLAMEVVLWKECKDPPLYLERRAYLGAIQDALAGVEGARGGARQGAAAAGAGARTVRCVAATFAALGS